MPIALRKRTVLLLAGFLCLATGAGIASFARCGGPRAFREQRAGTVRDTVSPFPVEFVRERISLHIDPDRVTVTGVYGFRCDSPAGERFHILYPFPVDARHAFPDSIAVYRPDGTVIPHAEDRAAGAARFTVNLLAHPGFTVVYRQRVTAPEARYILTTTAAWQKPLERAVFIVSLPESLRPAAFSYTPGKMRTVNGRRIYTVERKDFLPVRDFTVSWKRMEERRR